MTGDEAKARLKVGKRYTLRLRGGLTGPPTFERDVVVVIRDHVRQDFPPFAHQVVVTEPRQRLRWYVPPRDILDISPY